MESHHEVWTVNNIVYWAGVWRRQFLLLLCILFFLSHKKGQFWYLGVVQKYISIFFVLIWGKILEEFYVFKSLISAVLCHLGKTNPSIWGYFLPFWEILECFEPTWVCCYQKCYKKISLIKYCKVVLYSIVVVKVSCTLFFIQWRVTMTCPNHDQSATA